MTSIDTSVDLIINRLPRSVYDELCAQHKIDSNQIYLVDDPNFDAFGKRVVNVGAPHVSSSTDGVNVGFLDTYYVPKNGLSAHFDDTRVLTQDKLSSLGGDLSISYKTVGDWQVTVKEGSVDPAAVTVEWNSSPGSSFGWNFDVDGAKIPTGNSDVNALQLQVMTTVADELVILAAAKAVTWTSYDRVVANSELCTRFYEKRETSSATEIKDAFDNIPKPDMSEYAKLSSLEALSAEVDPELQDTSASGDFYRVYANKMNNLTACEDGMKIVLDDYSFSKSYVMKFTTPEHSEVKFAFYIDAGAGPQYDANMNINTSYKFPMNSGYVVEVKFDAMDIRPLAWTGDRQKMVFRTIEWSEEG